MLARFLAAAACALAGAAYAADLRLGTTHTLQDSGVLPVLVAAYGKSFGERVRAIVAGTGQVMKYAEQGDVDVVLTHSRADEERLVARGIGKARHAVMHNEFVIAGPGADPARIRGARDAAAALRRIQQAGAAFVSRGDDSGTHKKELQLWQDAGGFKSWPAYRATGQGAARTLMMAFELDAYELVDRATLRQLSRRHPMAVLVEGDARLSNEYAVTTLRSRAGTRIDEAAGQRFAAWLVSPEARSLIDAYRVEGERVFFAGARAP